jgi:hypothetical protein
LGILYLTQPGTFQETPVDLCTLIFISIPASALLYRSLWGARALWIFSVLSKNADRRARCSNGQRGLPPEGGESKDLPRKKANGKKKTEKRAESMKKKILIVEDNKDSLRS